MTPCVLVCPFKASPCVRSKRPRVYRHHAHMLKHMCAWCRYTRGRFERDTRARFEWTHGHTHTHTHHHDHNHSHNDTHHRHHMCTPTHNITRKDRGRSQRKREEKKTEDETRQEGKRREDEKRETRQEKRRSREEKRQDEEREDERGNERQNEEKDRGDIFFKKCLRTPKSAR